MQMLKDIMYAPESFSVRAMLVKGWETTVGHWGRAVMLVIGYAVVVVVLMLLIGLLGSQSGLLAVLLTIVLILSEIWFSIVFVKFGIAAARGQSPSVQELVAIQPKTLFSAIAVVILYALVIMAGLIFFILPGIYFAFVYYFAVYLVIDKGMSPIEAMQASKVMTSKHVFELFSYYCVSIATYYLILAPLYTFFLLAGFIVALQAKALLILGGLVAVVVGIVVIVIALAYMLTAMFGLMHIYNKLVSHSSN